MDFGKLPDVSNVNFKLPPDPANNRQIWEQKQQEAGILRTGCTGWGMKEWVGTWYPQGAKADSFLYHYSRQFQTIELNTTHYRIPQAETVQKWYEQSDAAFRFCPKLPQIISHSRDLGVQNDAISSFCQAIEHFQEKMGCCFMQLPPTFSVTNMPVLETFFKSWPKNIPLAVEFRHADWFEPDALDFMLETLYKYNKATVITDVAGRRDVAHMGLSSNQVLIRFVGNSLHASDYTRIDDWISRLRCWVSGVRDIFFFLHQPDNILAPEIALYFCEQWNESSGHQQLPKPKKGVTIGQLKLF